MATKKPPTLKSAKKRAWDAFSLYIRYRDAKRDKATLGGEAAYCITCGAAYPITGKGCLQAGHFIPGRNNQVLFDERQVYAQCYNCNYNLRGNWVPYLKRMKEAWGEQVVQDMLDTHKQVKKYSTIDYLEMEEKYKTEVNRIQEEL